MTDRIKGKVAQILSRRELVANVGAENGVVRGMKFAILNRRGAKIKDPDTGKEIGSVEIPKVLVEVVRVQPKLAVLRTYRTRRKNIGGNAALGLSLFQPQKIIEEPETLQLSDKPYEEELDESQSYVKVGDEVVQMVEDEFLAN